MNFYVSIEFVGVSLLNLVNIYRDNYYNKVISDFTRFRLKYF